MSSFAYSDDPVSRGADGARPLEPVGRDVDSFREAKNDSVGLRPTSEVSIESALADIMGGGEEVRSQIEKMKEAYDLREARQRIELVAESEEARKGQPLPAELREALAVSEESERGSYGETEQEGPPSWDEEPAFEEAENENEFGRELNAEASEGLNEDCHTPVGIETGDPSAKSENLSGKCRPVGRGGLRIPARARLARLNPAADAGAFREVLTQMAGLESKIQALQRSLGASDEAVRNLAPLLESVAVKNNIAPEAAAGGMMTRAIYPLAVEEGHERSEIQNTMENKRPVGWYVRPQQLMFVLAATVLIGIGLGFALRGRGRESGATEDKTLNNAKDITKAQRIKLKYLRAEKKQLEIRLQIEEEAKKLVAMREAALAAAKNSQTSQKHGLHVAEEALREARILLQQASEDGIRARLAIDWVSRAGA